MSDAAQIMRFSDLAHIRASGHLSGARLRLQLLRVGHRCPDEGHILPGGVLTGRRVRTGIGGAEGAGLAERWRPPFRVEGSRYFAVCVDSPLAPAVCGPPVPPDGQGSRAVDAGIPCVGRWAGRCNVSSCRLTSGSLQLSVTRQALEALEIPLPSLATQRVVTDLAAALRVSAPF